MQLDLQVGGLDGGGWTGMQGGIPGKGLAGLYLLGPNQPRRTGYKLRRQGSDIISDLTEKPEVILAGWRQNRKRPEQDRTGGNAVYPVRGLCTGHGRKPDDGCFACKSGERTMVVGGPGGSLAQRMLVGLGIEGGPPAGEGRSPCCTCAVLTWYFKPRLQAFSQERPVPVAVSIRVQAGRITCHKTGTFAGITRKEGPFSGTINGWRRVMRQERPWPAAVGPGPSPPVT